MDNKTFIVNKFHELIKKKYNIDLSIIKDSNINIVSILDEFSYNCFKYEANLHQLGTTNWKMIIDKVNPDFLLVEAAWEGINKEWTNKIAYYSKSKDKTLEKIIKYCHIKNIQTVFWAKEDPYDFDVFIDAASQFQYIFTTDENCISKYKDILKHDDVYLLSFAAQPKLHNPIDKDKEKKGNIIFPGGWYHKFPYRCYQMEYLLDGASTFGLTIYDRFYNSQNTKNKFPHKYKPYIRNGLEYLEMVNEYKKYHILLNSNSVDDSPTNFSRRVFESLGSGTPVVSSYSLGIENYFNDIVSLVNNKDETINVFSKLLGDKELLDRLSLLGVREIMNNHTYRHRLCKILEILDISDKEDENEGISVITVTNRKFSLENIISNYINQNYKSKELIIIINSNSINLSIWKSFVSFRDDIRIYKIDESVSLGECLNFGVENSSYSYISKFDDDDYYGPNYLIDAINTFKYTDASIVGKYTVYGYLEDSSELVLRFPGFENRYIDYVAGSTLTFKKEIFNKIKFKHQNKSEDTLFLKEAIIHGFKIYSSDRFNHIIFRRRNLKTHTWQISEKDFKNKSIPIILNNRDIRDIVNL